jgi:hypothetical protein
MISPQLVAMDLQRRLSSSSLKSSSTPVSSQQERSSPGRTSTTATIRQIERGIPFNPPAVVHIYDRRINLDQHASLYSLLRSWLQDDLYRCTPPFDDDHESLLDQEAMEDAWCSEQRRRKKSKRSGDTMQCSNSDGGMSITAPSFRNSKPSKMVDRSSALAHGMATGKCY